MSRDNQLKKKLQNKSLRGVIFDFDGTLLDVKEILEKSIEEVLVEKKINLDMETTIQEIGALLETIQGYPLPQVLLHSYEIFKHISALKDLTYFTKIVGSVIPVVGLTSKYLSTTTTTSESCPLRRFPTNSLP